MCAFFLTGYESLSAKIGLIWERREQYAEKQCRFTFVPCIFRMFNHGANGCFPRGADFRACQGMGFRPSHRTSHLPLRGNPGFLSPHPSHPAHIRAMAVSRPPLPGR